MIINVPSSFMHLLWCCSIHLQHVTQRSKQQTKPVDYE